MKFVKLIKSSSSLQYVIRVKITYDNNKEIIGYWSQNDETGNLENATIFNLDYEAFEVCNENVNDLQQDEVKKVYEVVQVETELNLTDNIVKTYTNK